MKNLLFISLIIIFLLPQQSISQINKLPSDAEEGFYTLRYSDFQTEISTFIINKKNYLPLMTTLSFLKIFYEPTNEFNRINGFFIKTDNIYQFDFLAKTITIGDKTVLINPEDCLKDALEIYVLPEVLEKVFDLKLKINNARLRIDLLSEQDLPVLLDVNREKDYMYMPKSDDKYAPLAFNKNFHLLNGGILEYNLSYTQRQNQSQYSNYNLNLGMELLGGAFHVNTVGNYDFKTKKNYYNNNYYLKYLFQNDLISQFSVGNLQYMNYRNSGMNSLRMADEQIFGAMISNETALFHSDYFSDLHFSDYLGQNWQTEIYLNGRIHSQMRTGDDGYYNFIVPLNYGISTIEMKFYGPKGEYIEKKRSYNIQNNFLEPGKIKYTIWGGKTTYTEKYQANADASIGIFTWLTGSARLKYLVDEKKYEYSTQIAANLLDNLTLTTDFYPKQGINWGLCYNSNFSFINFNYTKFLSNDEKSINPTLNSVNMFGSLNQIFGLPLNLSVNATGTEFTNNTSLNYSGMLSSFFNSFSVRARYKGNYSNDEETNAISTHQLDFTTSYYINSIKELVSFIDYNRVELSCNYDIISKKLCSSTISFATSLFSFFNLDFGFSKDFLTNSFSGNARLSMNTSLFRSNSSIDYIDKQSSVSNQLQGVVSFDPANINLLFSNNNIYNSNFGFCGAYLRFFEDKNNNGKHDKGEPYIQDVKISMDNNKSGGFQYEDDAIVISNLVPNYRYNVKIDMKSLKNPIWQPKYINFSFISEPNSFKNIDVPCLPTGIIEGKVERFVDGKFEAQNRVRIHLVSKESNFRDNVPVFTDGTYYKMGLIAGSYTAYVDSMQLNVLKFWSEPSQIDFVVKVNDDGDYIGDLNFKLYSNNYKDDTLKQNASENILSTKSNKKNIESKINLNNLNKEQQQSNTTDSAANTIINDVLNTTNNDDSNIISKNAPGSVNKLNIEKEKSTDPDDLAIDNFIKESNKDKSDNTQIAKNHFIINFKNIKQTNLDINIKRELKNIAEYLQKYPNAKILITAYTCELSTNDEEKKISEARANEAKKYFLDKGIKEQRMLAVGKGTKNPISENKTKSGKQKNSRIEIKIIN